MDAPAATGAPVERHLLSLCRFGVGKSVVNRQIVVIFGSIRYAVKSQPTLGRIAYDPNTQKIWSDSTSTLAGISKHPDGAISDSDGVCGGIVFAQKDAVSTVFRPAPIRKIDACPVAYRRIVLGGSVHARTTAKYQ